MISYESKHFTIEPLVEGVYAAIHKEGGWAVGNAGIVDLGDRTLVFDTFLTPRAATDLRKAAEELTGRPVSLVVNSHYHIWGNQAFDPETDILSTIETRKLILSEGMEEVAWHKQNSSARWEELRAQYADEADEEKRREVSTWITYYQAMIESFPELSVRLPNLAFSEKYVVHGKERDVELIPHQNGHTGSDTVLFMPSEGIVFMSDLLFVGCHPYLADGDPGKLVTILKEIEAMKARVFLPGHGPVGGQEDLGQMIDYVHKCKQAVQKFIDTGGEEDDILQLVVPDPFSSWESPDFFYINARLFFQKVKMVDMKMGNSLRGKNFGGCVK